MHWVFLLFISVEILFLTSRSAFNLFDINGDGHIDFQEMNCLLRTLGQRPTEDEVRELLKVRKYSKIVKFLFNFYTVEPSIEI